MKISISRPINPALTQRIAEMFRSGAAQEDVLLAMRRAGLNQIESIKLLRDNTGVTLAEAKEITHLSAASQDRRISFDALHDVASDALAELEREVPASSDKYEFASDHGS